MVSEYRGYKISLKANVLGLWDVYINDVLQDSKFMYDYNAMEYAYSLIRLGLNVKG
jgi:hypothetical protein